MRIFFQHIKFWNRFIDSLLHECIFSCLQDLIHNGSGACPSNKIFYEFHPSKTKTFRCERKKVPIHFHLIEATHLLCLTNLLNQLGPVKRFCVFEHSVMTNFNCACPAIQRGQRSGFLSEGSSWLNACMSEQRRFWRDCADAQARLNLRCSHMR